MWRLLTSTPPLVEEENTISKNINDLGKNRSLFRGCPKERNDFADEGYQQFTGAGPGH
jgi:hypothetical protein